MDTQEISISSLPPEMARAVGGILPRSDKVILCLLSTSMYGTAVRVITDSLILHVWRLSPLGRLKELQESSMVVPEIGSRSLQLADVNSVQESGKWSLGGLIKQEPMVWINVRDSSGDVSNSITFRFRRRDALFERTHRAILEGVRRAKG